MSIYSADPWQDRDIREAAREERRAAMLSRLECRAVDSFGFSDRVTVNQGVEDSAEKTGDTPNPALIDAGQQISSRPASS